MTMNQRVSPTLIGAFVLGAVLLAVTAVVLIGSGRYFRRTYPFVLYFPGSVNGLRVGAPVKFRGVEIGSVEDIRLQLKPDQSVFRIPVIIGIDPEKITSLGGSETILNSPAEYQSAIDGRAPGAASDREFRHRGAVCGVGLFPRQSGHLCPTAGHPQVPIPRDSDRAVLDREGADGGDRSAHQAGSKRPRGPRRLCPASHLGTAPTGRLAGPES